MVRLPPRLVRPVIAPMGVSLPGLIAASARANVLGSVKSTLQAIGLPPVRPGIISTIINGREAALASRLGCEARDIVQASTPYVGQVKDRVIRWGDGALSRYSLETRRRRISPASLHKSPYHRATWMNLLLDYCPESLERLVDACPRCLKPLGWLAAWGLGHCDDPDCGPVAASGETLPMHVVQDYRLFASLASPVAGEHKAFVSELEGSLQALPSVTIVDLAVRLGAAVEGIAVRGGDAVRLLSASQRARVVGTGARMLVDWPHTLRRAVQHRIETDARHDGRARRQLRKALLHGLGAKNGGDGVSTLLQEALPEIFVEVGSSFAGISAPTILGSAAALRLGINNSELAAAARDGVFTEEGVFEHVYRRVQYRLDEIEAAEAAWRASVPIQKLTTALGLPRYACEHIIALGCVAAETHAFVLRLPGQPYAIKSSLAAFTRSLIDACSSASPPPGAKSLVTAMRVVGGRLKPWAHVLEAVRSGSLACWLAPGQQPLTARMRVLPRDLAPFARLDANSNICPDSVSAKDMSQIDAMSVLNLNQCKGPELSEHGLLPFARGNRSLLIPVADVLAVAAENVSTAEAAARLGLYPSAAYPLIARAIGPHASPVGWSRPLFDEAFGAVL